MKEYIKPASAEYNISVANNLMELSIHEEEGGDQLTRQQNSWSSEDWAEDEE